MQCQRLYVRLHGGCDGEQLGIGTMESLPAEMAISSIPGSTGMDHRDICAVASASRNGYMPR